MSIETDTVAQDESNEPTPKPEINRQERNRLIVHLGRVFTRRYDMQVLPTKQRGTWACTLDPKTSAELKKYINGERDTLDDLPQESFEPKRIIYDEHAAMEMSMDEITTLLYHEAGHARYTDFRSMMEGQRHAKDEGHLPTSFWITFEGIEDPRVNSLEGEESPAIDKQIRTNQANDLQKRITEAPLTDRPYMLQFAYNSFHYWLHGEGLPELKDTEVGRLGEVARPLLEQYFQNTDIEQRKILQQQIWDIVKVLEKKDIEDEQKKQMAQQKGMKGKDKQGQGEGSQSGQGQEGEQSSGQGSGDNGDPGGSPSVIGGKGQDGGTQQSPSGETQQGNGGKKKQTEKKRFLNRLKDAVLGRREKPEVDEQDSSQQPSSRGEEKKQERVDLSQLSEEQLQELEDAINQLTPEERQELARKARETIDQLQKEALEEELSKTLRMEKNKETGEYEAHIDTATDKEIKQAEKNYQDATEEVEEEERAEYQRQEAERVIQEQLRKQLDAEKRMTQEMKKAGFDPDEREKFLLYQQLEDSMYANVRNFRQAIEKVIPRRKESVYEGGYFSGTKFDRRDLIRKAPLGNEQFHMRQVDRPTGEPRLFIGLLVDNSGSMDGTKMEEARRTVIFFSKVCRDMEIPFMSAAFGDDAEVIKQFRQDFDSPAEKIKPKIIDATSATGANTNLHAGLDVTIQAMNEQRRRLSDSHGLVFVITDGKANRGLEGQELKNYIDENRGRLTFKAFGLSDNEHERQGIQNHLNLYFGESNCAYPKDFKDLPDEAFRLLRINLMQFQRFLS